MATARAVRQAYDLRFAELGLNLSEASLLAYVEESGALTQTRLAERLGIGRAAMGSVIDSLEKRGLVERNPDPDDRRVWLVDLTAAGKEMVQQVTERDVVLRKELRAGISREDRSKLAEVLVALGNNLAGILADDD